jgi:cell division protein FtsI/penicillin-binding protein 2
MTSAFALVLLSAGLQSSIVHALGGRQGAAVVLDVASGKTLAAYPADLAERRSVKPGSTIKPFTLSVILAAGAGREAPCERRVMIAGRNLSCSHPAVAGGLGPAEALAYSCNSWFAQMARRLDPAALVSALRGAGFTVGEAPATSEALQLLALGEGDVSITPLGLARAYRRLATSAQPMVRDGLRDAALYGTARLARPEALGVAGKTGTATSEDRAWKHGWFAGFAPDTNPRVVVVVFVEKGQGGGDAAPIAREVFEAWQRQQ